MSAAARPCAAPRARQRGVMLLEVLIAILIFSIGILALMGMQALSMRATVDAKYRSEASFLANQIVGLMWADAANLDDYALDASAAGACTGTAACAAWLADVRAKLPADTATDNVPTVVISSRTVTVTMRWKRKGEQTGSQHEVIAQILRSNDS